MLKIHGISEGKSDKYITAGSTSLSQWVNEVFFFLEFFAGVLWLEYKVFTFWNLDDKGVGVSKVDFMQLLCKLLLVNIHNISVNLDVGEV